MSDHTCPTCEGTGDGNAEDHGGTIQYHPCPACGGSGLDPALVEAVGRYLEPGPWWDDQDHYKASIALYLERATDLLHFIAAYGKEKR